MKKQLTAIWPFRRKIDVALGLTVGGVAFDSLPVLDWIDLPDSRKYQLPGLAVRLAVGCAAGTLVTQRGWRGFLLALGSGAIIGYRGGDTVVGYVRTTRAEHIQENTAFAFGAWLLSRAVFHLLRIGSQPLRRS